MLIRLYLILFNLYPLLTIYIIDKVLNFKFLNNKELEGLGTRPKLLAHQQESQEAKAKQKLKVIVILWDSKEHIARSNYPKVKMSFFV